MNRAQQQLADLEIQLDQQTSRMRALVDNLDEQSWGRRPPSGGWSVAECIQHLNITSRSLLPALHAALERLSSGGRREPSRYRRDLFGWLLTRSLEPPARRKYVTSAPFDPVDIEPREEVVAEWANLQDSLKGVIRACHGLDLMKATIVSPFNKRVRYNVYSALLILATHQRRHLWQAEQVAMNTSARR